MKIFEKKKRQFTMGMKSIESSECIFVLLLLLLVEWDIQLCISHRIIVKIRYEFFK